MNQILVTLRQRSRLVPVAAFTLVELLVVVAIIGILASLLAPALRKAVDSAKHASCTSNLRQVGFALNAYMQDYNGWSLLNSGPWGATSDQHSWGWQMEALGYVPPLKSGQHVLVCPSIPPYKGKKYVHTYTLRGTNTFPGRPTNFRVSGKVRDNGNTAYSVAPKSYPDSPSRFPVVFGSIADTGPTYGMTLHAYVSGDSLCGEHGGLPNFLYFDLHVGMGVQSYNYFSCIKNTQGTKIVQF